MISRKFIRNSIIYTVAGSLQVVSAVILLPFYLHYLSVEEFGAMAVYTTFSALVQVVITYSFDTSVYIHFHDFKNDQEKLSQFVSSAFLFMAMVGVVTSVVAMGAGVLVFDSLLADRHVSFYPYGFLSVLTSVFQAFFKVNSSLLQSQERPVLYFWSNLLSFSLVAVFTVGGLILFPDTLIGPIGGRLLAAVLSGGWALIRIFREFGVHYNFPILKETFGYNNASFIYQIQQWLINNFDRFIIVYYLTVQDVGIYDFAFKCMLVIDFIISGLYNSFYPKVIGHIKDQKAEVKESTVAINRYYNGLVAVMMLLVSLGIFFFPVLIDFGILKSNYGESWKYIPFLGMVYLLKAIRFYFVLPFGALKYVKPLPVIYLVISAVKIGLMVVLVRWLSVYAVIFSAGVSTLLEIVLLRIVMKSKFIFRFNTFKMILAPVLLGTLILMLEPWQAINQYLRHGFYIVLCGMILWFVYRNEIKLIKVPKIF